MNEGSIVNQTTLHVKLLFLLFIKCQVHGDSRGPMISYHFPTPTLDRSRVFFFIDDTRVRIFN